MPEKCDIINNKINLRINLMSESKYTLLNADNNLYKNDKKISSL